MFNTSFSALPIIVHIGGHTNRVSIVALGSIMGHWFTAMSSQTGVTKADFNKPLLSIKNIA